MRRHKDDKKFYENKKYIEYQDRNCEKTGISEEKRELDKKRFTNSSTGTNTENKSDIKEETARYESSNTNQKMSLDFNAIPDSRDNLNNGDELNNINLLNNLSGNRTRNNRENSPNGQTPQTKKKSKNIFGTVTINSNTLETKHSRLTKDNQRIKVCRKSVNSMRNYLNYRCERRGLELKKVKVKELFGNINKQRWFIRRKIKILFVSNPNNRKVIKKMMKVDPIFKRFVELKFEDFYNKYFILKNRYIPYRNNFMLLSHFETFEKYLEKLEKETNEIEEKKNKEYVKQLKETGNNLIKEIKEGTDYSSRCNRKRIRSNICFIKYK